MELHQTQKVVAVDDTTYRVVVCGRQWGKTTLAVEEISACGYAKGGREIGYLASTFDQARNIAWVMLKEKTRPIWAKLPNESRLELDVKTQDNGVSRISLGGYENIETYRGRQFDFLVPDEVALMRNFEYNWNAILEPTLAFRKGKALFLGTPKGYDHLFRLYELGKNNTNKFYRSWRFTSYDNPFLPKDRIDQAKQTSTEDYFAQEYLADFRKHTGLVYKEVQREVHVVEPFDIPEGWLVYRGIDFGSTNPTACVWIAVDPDDNWFVFQEHYETGQTIDYHAGVINAKIKRNVASTYGDPSGAQWISEFAQRGVYITPANKEVGTNFNSWVRFGIEKVAEKIKIVPGHTVNQLSMSVPSSKVGMPSLFVFSSCINLVRELETYRWKEKSVTQAQDLNEPDVPEKANDHALDALRYFAVSYKKEQPKYIEPENDISKRNWGLI